MVVVVAPAMRAEALESRSLKFGCWFWDDGDEDELRVGVAMSMGDAAVTCIFERSLRLSKLSGEEGPREKMRSGGEEAEVELSRSLSSSSRIFWAAKSSSSIKVAAVVLSAAAARDCSRRGRSTAALENQLWRRKDIGGSTWC
jgi:hypothetical protein